MFLLARVMYCIRPYSGPTDRGVKASSRRQNGGSVVTEHPHVGSHGQNRASLLMNPVYSIARTRQCPRKSCSPQRSSSYSAHPSGWYSYSSNSKDAGFIDAPMPISPHCIAAAHVQAPPSAGVGSRNGSCVGSVESNIKINLTAKHPHYKTSPNLNPNPNPYPSSVVWHVFPR